MMKRKLHLITIQLFLLFFVQYLYCQENPVLLLERSYYSDTRGDEFYGIVDSLMLIIVVDDNFINELEFKRLIKTRKGKKKRTKKFKTGRLYSLPGHVLLYKNKSDEYIYIPVEYDDNGCRTQDSIQVINSSFLTLKHIIVLAADSNRRDSAYREIFDLLNYRLKDDVFPSRIEHKVEHKLSTSIYDYIK